MRGSFQDLKPKPGSRQASNSKNQSNGSGTLKTSAKRVTKEGPDNTRPSAPKDVSQRAKNSIKKNEALLLGLY